MPTDPLKQAEENQIKNLEEKTGKSFNEWKEIVNKSSLEKHLELVNMLKEKYKIGHGYANLIVHHAKQSHAGSSDDADLITQQYKGKEEMMPWYEKLMKEIKAFGNDVEIAPKKTYVSLRRKKQFAIIQPSTKTRMDVGLNMKNVALIGKLEAGGSWNAMCTHRVKVESEKDINGDLVKWIRQAYDQAS